MDDLILEIPGTNNYGEPAPKRLYPSAMAGSSIVEADVRVHGRLRSTRSGRNFNWAQRNLQGCFNNRLFEPRIDILFKGNVKLHSLGWHYLMHGANLGSYTGEPPERAALMQCGTLVERPFIIASDEYTDLSYRWHRKELFRLFEDIGTPDLHPVEVPEPVRQGHLSIWNVTPFMAYGKNLYTPEDLDRRYLPHGQHFPCTVKYWTSNRPIYFFNHAFQVVERYNVDAEFRVYGYDNERLLFVRDCDILITSPDHIMEHLVLQSGWYLARHPLPNGYVD